MRIHPQPRSTRTDLPAHRALLMLTACVGAAALSCSNGERPVPPSSEPTATAEQALFPICAPAAPASAFSAVNVLDFGAVGDGTVDDQPAIQAAIDCAAQLSYTTPTVYFPAGKYLLNRTLWIKDDNVSLVGAPGAVLVQAPTCLTGCSLTDVPATVLVHKLSTGGTLLPTKRVVIDGLTVAVDNGTNGGTSYGVIQMNNCEDCVVEDVLVQWAGSATGSAKPQNVDGIVFALGSSGTIRGAVVDGIPKAGIYVNGTSHDVTIEGCEVRNTDGPLGRVGISIAASRVRVVNSSSHDNLYSGLFIAAVGTVPPLGSTDIQVVGGQYYANGSPAGGSGIFIGSGYSSALSRRVQVTGAEVASTDHGSGVVVSGAADVTLANIVSHGNGLHGILVETPIGAAWDQAVVTNGIHITDPTIYDNGCDITLNHAVYINSAVGVTVNGGRIYDTAGACNVNLLPFYFGRNANNIDNDQIRILDPDLPSSVAAAFLASSASPLDQPANGFFRFQHGSAPGALQAPTGSQLTDLQTGTVYRRTALPPAWTTP